jgi:hypothetical protein
MTLEEIKDNFPVGCQVMFRGDEYTVTDYYEDTNVLSRMPYWVVVTDSILVYQVSPYELKLVHGPAVQETNHDGMVFNPYTKRWAWF